MKTFIKSFVITAGLLLSPLASAANISLPEQLGLQAVNGERSITKPLNLPKGDHLLELRFAEMYASSADDSGRWLRSGPLYLPLSVGDEQLLTLTLPKLYSYDEARRFLKAPKATLNRDGKPDGQVILLDHAAMMARMAAAH
ncbi:DUF2057 family protein [Shewanella sp. FJAT-52076]|uniref:DUF2057 family protein n=1 Tax=Shewanella sp. FJAT-52076 TaxID=2864202 RepID=UPI001C65F956|nr:DUF2057 family protein [Shewanella sp. FJAT-52076]QYJ75224.1 DUF2057 domain-containing protein [Shewanella sp. FJAT-52076]